MESPDGARESAVHRDDLLGLLRAESALTGRRFRLVSIADQVIAKLIEEQSLGQREKEFSIGAIGALSMNFLALAREMLVVAVLVDEDAPGYRPIRAEIVMESDEVGPEMIRSSSLSDLTH
jgi:hypothetical protein